MNKPVKLIKVADVIELVFASFRPTLEAMLERAGMGNETPVDQVFAHFADAPKSEDERLALAALSGALSRLNTSKFAPKLSLTKQCEIVALYRMGYNADILAKVYGIDRKTVTHMYNPMSDKYKGVKREEKMRGSEGLIKAYVNDEVIANVEKFTLQTSSDGNNKLANTKQGVHVVRGVNCTFDHRVEIKWCEPGSQDVEVAGWYHKDMDGDFPEAWIRGDDDSMKNSQAAYNAALKLMEDPL